MNDSLIVFADCCDFGTNNRSTLSEPLDGRDVVEAGVCECSGSDREVRRKAQAFAADRGESMGIESKQACNRF